MALQVNIDDLPTGGIIEFEKIGFRRNQEIM
jgi:hypothetical protein